MKNSRLGFGESLVVSAVLGAGILYAVHKNKHLKKELEAAKEISESSKEEYHIKKCEEQKKEDKQIREEANDILNDKQKASRFFNAKYDAMDENGHKVDSKTISPYETITLDIFDVDEDRANLHISLIYKKINAEDLTYAEIIKKNGKVSIVLKTDIDKVAVKLSINKEGFISEISSVVCDDEKFDDDNKYDSAFEKHCYEKLKSGKYKAVNIHNCSNVLPLSDRVDDYEDDDYEDDDYWEE